MVAAEGNLGFRYFHPEAKRALEEENTWWESVEGDEVEYAECRKLKSMRSRILDELSK